MAPTDDSASKSVNVNRGRKRVEAVTTTLKRARNGSAFTRCEGCNKDVAVALISMHDCGLDAKIKMNLETIAVETHTETATKKPAEKKKTVKSKEQPAKKAKKERDPSKPKRPPTAFFLFMEEFRITFKEANPDNKKVAVVAKEGGEKWKSMTDEVAKEGGEKWKSMTDEEKKPYIERAAELKENYQKALDNPNDAENEDEKAEEEPIEVDDDEGSPKKVEEVADDE